MAQANKRSILRERSDCALLVTLPTNQTNYLTYCLMLPMSIIFSEDTVEILLGPLSVYGGAESHCDGHR